MADHVYYHSKEGEYPFLYVLTNTGHVSFVLFPRELILCRRNLKTTFCESSGVHMSWPLSEL